MDNALLLWHPKLLFLLFVLPSAIAIQIRNVTHQRATQILTIVSASWHNEFAFTITDMILQVRI